MPFSINHILPWKGHCTPLILAGCVIGITRMAWLKHFRCRIIFHTSLATVMGLKIQISKNIAICSILCHLNSYTISFSKPTSLPCSQYIKIDTELLVLLSPEFIFVTIMHLKLFPDKMSKQTER